MKNLIKPTAPKSFSFSYKIFADEASYLQENFLYFYNSPHRAKCILTKPGEHFLLVHFKTKKEKIEHAFEAAKKLVGWGKVPSIYL